ncbi:DsbA family oxidoreductase [Sedimentitalea sp. HM32M-2]|uniref:DsbA family oxidoreductase n=1 Tax=Sedimentitalea sp. HM32M-2 TaxID=3351566 RepID=UPI00362A43D4
MSSPHAPSPDVPIQVDIVSDVVCPWCIVGFKQLHQAMARTGLSVALRWHPFELNPDMPPEGQNLRAHMIGKYSITAEQSDQARDRLTELGAELGFDFNFSDDIRILNTFAAHQLLDWADEQRRQTALKLALFAGYFTEHRDVSDPEILIEIAVAVGLDGAAARQVLSTGSHAAPVREKQQFWHRRGITGVPAMIFAGKYLLTGAQGVDQYASLLQRCRDEEV